MGDTLVIGGDVVKIAVIGAPGCGKSTLINAFHSKHLTQNAISIGRSKLYPCQFMSMNEMKSAVIFEFQGYHDSLSLVAELEKCQVTGVILMYAIDDPSSFQTVITKYIPGITLWTVGDYSRLTVNLVGSKSRLRDDELVNLCLALQNQAPVTSAQGADLLKKYDLDRFFECSIDNLENMYAVVEFTLQISFYCLEKWKSAISK